MKVLIAGGSRGAVGLALVALARLAWRGAGSRWLATALLLPGLSLIVHFGVFDVLAGAWRRAGVDCTPLFRSPLRSASLGEFWGRRWNLAFSEMTALAVYQPLVLRIGRRPALAASFLGSGLLHELAISAGPGGLRPAPGVFRPARRPGPGRAAPDQGRPPGRSRYLGGPGLFLPGRSGFLVPPTPSGLVAH